MNYEVGSKVKVIKVKSETMADGMAKLLGKKVTIVSRRRYHGANYVYRIKEDDKKYGWMNDDFESNK